MEWHRKDPHPDVSCQLSKFSSYSTICLEMPHKHLPPQWTVRPLPCCESALNTYSLSWSLLALQVVDIRLNFQLGKTEDCFLLGPFPSACLSCG